MTKKIILTLISIFLLCGCNKETIEVEEKTETKKDYYLEAVVDIYDEYVPMLNTVTKVTYIEEEYSEEGAVESEETETEETEEVSEETTVEE